MTTTSQIAAAAHGQTREVGLTPVIHPRRGIRWVRAAGSWVLLCVSLAIVGCDIAGLRGTLCEVTGAVTWQGEPVVNAWVVFIPKFPEPREGVISPIAYGRTDAAGHYRLQTSAQSWGALPGAYFVLISRPKGGDSQHATGDESAAHRESLPARFNRRTTLSTRVPASPSITLDWNL